MLLRMYSGCFCLHLAAGTTKLKEGGGGGGGLGLRRLSCHSPAAYIASFQSSGLSSLSGKYLSSSVDLYNSLVDPHDFLTVELVQNSHLSQKVLSSKLEDQQFNNLFQSATLTDRACLLSISSPHASAWLSVTPSPPLGSGRILSSTEVVVGYPGCPRPRLPSLSFLCIG